MRPRNAKVKVFFFQAEDGIRDYKVTGVQTCALPICRGRSAAARSSALRDLRPAHAAWCPSALPVRRQVAVLSREFFGRHPPPAKHARARVGVALDAMPARQPVLVARDRLPAPQTRRMLAGDVALRSGLLGG